MASCNLHSTVKCNFDGIARSAPRTHCLSRNALNNLQACCFADVRPYSIKRRLFRKQARSLCDWPRNSWFADLVQTFWKSRDTLEAAIAKINAGSGYYSRKFSFEFTKLANLRVHRLSLGNMSPGKFLERRDINRENIRYKNIVQNEIDQFDFWKVARKVCILKTMLLKIFLQIYDCLYHSSLVNVTTKFLR